MNLDEILKQLITQGKLPRSMFQETPAPNPGWGAEAIRLARLWNPQITETYLPAHPTWSGSWYAPEKGRNSRIEIHAGASPSTRPHEYGHELQYRTGIGASPGIGQVSPREVAPDAPYQFGAAPNQPISEAVASIIGGSDVGSHYYRQLSPEQRSMANSLAKMMMAAAYEKEGKTLPENLPLFPSVQ